MKIKVIIATLISIFSLSALNNSEGAEGGYRFLWSGFSTSLAGRSPMQIHNAGRAARDLDGIIIPPGRTFSFNEHVGSRDGGKGYVRAPMINDLGYLQDIPGGGICQLATTIFNAALYAGLEIVERHPHSRAVSYVPPGRDATIATWRKDLKLRNPHKAPLVLRIRMEDQRVTASFWSTEDKTFQVEIHSDSIPLEPATATAESAGMTGLRGQTGGKGFSVITTRTVRTRGQVREQIISRDFYPPPSIILKDVGP
jgi:vancomycin resistance protein YoaR